MVLSNMTDLDVEDTLTKLNTQLNKSMVLMDTSTEMETPQSKSNKSIKINTKAQPPSPYNASPKPRKSILKTIEKKSIDSQQNVESDKEISTPQKVTKTKASRRPHNIKDLLKNEDLVIETTDSTFSLSDLSDSEDIWIMDIPATIDPMKLKGQSLIFGGKSKFKINNEKYYATNHQVKCNVTCVLKTDKETSQYKTVNIKPAGAFTIRRKLSSITKLQPIEIENHGVPFPKNLRKRHPLFGANHKSEFREV